MQAGEKVPMMTLLSLIHEEADIVGLTIKGQHLGLDSLIQFKDSRIAERVSASIKCYLTEKCLHKIWI